MDWMQDTGTNVWAFPRGMARDDRLSGTLSWTSEHASLVASAYDLMTVDGFNDAGLGAHQLFLSESDYGELDQDRPTLSVAVWMQYVLDTCATVADAVAWLDSSRVQIAAQSDPLSGLAVTCISLSMTRPGTRRSSSISTARRGSITIAPTRS